MAGGNGPLATPRRSVTRCAIYTRKSTEEGLEQEFNTLDAQRDSAEAFIRSQRGEGWVPLPDRYDDGGFTGANMDRPALQRLLQDVREGLVDCVMVYKVDRLTRSVLDFARIMEVLDKHGTSFVSVTQQFNTTSSLGRLTLNNWILPPAHADTFDDQTMAEPLTQLIRDKLAKYQSRPMATPSNDLVLLAFLNQGLMYNSPIETPRRPLELLVEEVRRLFAKDHETFQRAFLFLAPSPGERAFRLW